eukprot:gene4704-biopygen14901
MYKRYVDLTYDLTFLWSAVVYARAREFLIKDAVCFGDSSSYSCYTELCELATAKVIADKEAARLSCVSMRKASLDELDDHIMSSQDLAHVFKCCASVVPKGQLRDKLVPNDLPLDVIIAHAGSISGAVMADVASAVGDFPKLTHAVFSRNYGYDIKQACIASQDAEIRKQVHCMVANIVKRICVRDWDSMFRGVFEMVCQHRAVLETDEEGQYDAVQRVIDEEDTWRLHDQLVRFLCRVVFMLDAFDFFVYFGVPDFGHVR